MKKIRLIAGESAFRWIKERGLHANDIRAVVAAAGGPKWFTTFGLVRFIIADLLKDANHSIDFMGASVGSWQMTTALLDSPSEGLDRLRKAYAGHIYSENPDKTEISEASHKIVLAMLDGHAQEVLDHPTRNIHIVTSRGKGLLGKDKKPLLISGFGYTYLLNALSRKAISSTIERVVFSNTDRLPYDPKSDIIPTTQVMLNDKNLVLSLRASAAIPIIIDPIYHIDQAPRGTYWDGGTSDYHITFPYKYSDGIVVHPHFGPDVMPGWFDKKGIRRRRASAQYMDRVVLICPSAEYVQSLPRKQISDLKDFYHYGTDQEARIQYWDEISARSAELGQELQSLIASGNISAEVELYQP